MAGELQFKCHICSVPKQTSNRWLVAWFRNGVLSVAHFSKERASESDVMCLCGEGHYFVLASQIIPEIAEGKHDAAFEIPALVLEEELAQ